MTMESGEPDVRKEANDGKLQHQLDSQTNIYSYFTSKLSQLLPIFIPRRLEGLKKEEDSDQIFTVINIWKRYFQYADPPISSRFDVITNSYEVRYTFDLTFRYNGGLVLLQVISRKQLHLGHE